MVIAGRLYPTIGRREGSVATCHTVVVEGVEAWAALTWVAFLRRG